jgi:hypothetical protein
VARATSTCGFLVTEKSKEVHWLALEIDNTFAEEMLATATAV